MKILALDGNSLVNRAFYAIRALTNHAGMHTNAVYGFMNILLKLLDEERPDGLCVAFDLRAPTFRHAEYELYKANRKGMPDELAEQMPVLKDALRAMNIPIFELEGYEADDLLGAISVKCAERGDTCVIVTGDRDSLQLIGGNVRVKLVSTKGGQTITHEFDEPEFFKEYGFEPALLVDLKALMGDSSDNIPGVAGVGEKTALDIVRRFGGVGGIYERLDELDLKETLKKKLEAGREAAFMSRRLAEIDTNAPLEYNAEAILRTQPDSERLYELFMELGFKSLIERMGLSKGARIEAANAAAPDIEAEAVRDNEALSLMFGFIGERVAHIACPDSLNAAAICAGDRIFTISASDFDGSYSEFLNKLFSPSVKKCGHGLKTLMTRLLDEGISFGGFEFDAALGAYVLNPSESGYSLEKLAVEYLKTELPDQRAFNGPDSFSVLGGAEDAMKALAAHARAICGLFELQKPELEKQGMNELYYSVELPLCGVLADMEHAGFMVDREMLHEFGDMLSGRIDACRERIYTLAGGGFNINSTKELGEVLFTKLGLPTDKKTKTGYSTNIEVLQKLKGKHEIIEEIIEFRMLTKLKSTYADGLLKVIAPDGRIHSNFQMTVTTTGRLSSTEPNLQNIPVRTQLGSSIRRMFVPQKQDWLLADADYSQIELRILAHISNDETMIKAFIEGEDIHNVTASQVFGVSADEVTPEMRRSAKAVNFGIVYGISEFSLAEDIGVSRFEARRYIDNYLEKYSGVRGYMHEIVERAKSDGYVSTLFGRRRYLPELKASNYNIRSFGERVALNTPIQGTAADIIKLAMVNVARRLKAEGLVARLLLQVHDELIVEMPREEEESVRRILKQEMEGAASLKVPLFVDVGIGENWYAAKK